MVHSAHVGGEDVAICGSCSRSVHPTDRWCGTCGAPVPGASGAPVASETDPRDWHRIERSHGPSRRYAPNDLRVPWNRSFSLVLVGIAMMAALTAWAIFGLAIGLGGPSTLSVPLVLGFIASIGCLVASVFSWYVFLYRAWDQAQAFTNRTTPGKAVGFLFIPFFNLYWHFVAYLHLARAMNFELAHRRVDPQPRVSEGLTIAACVLAILIALLPIFAALAGVAALICFSILAVQLKRAAMAIAGQ